LLAWLRFVLTGVDPTGTMALTCAAGGGMWYGCGVRAAVAAPLGGCIIGV